MMPHLMTALYEAGVLDEGWAWVLGTATKGTVVLLLTVGVSALLRRSSAARRHLVWTLGAVALLLIPLGSVTLPKLAVPVPALIPGTPTDRSISPENRGDLWTSSAMNTTAQTPSAAESPGGQPSIPGGQPSTPGGQPSTHAPAADLQTLGPLAQASTSSDAFAPLSGSEMGQAVGMGSPWTLLLLGVWLAGLLGVVSVLCIARARVRWLERRATSIEDGPLYASLLEAADTLGVSRLPQLLQGDDRVVPMTWGTIRPKIILPAGAGSWAPWRIEAVLLHELGHIVRRDCLAQAVVQMACAVHWFNPMAWYGARRMRVEREHACDDLVVSFGHERASYALDLVDLARTLRPRWSATAALCFARPSSLRDRLVALMDETRDRRPVSSASMGIAVAVSLTVALPLAALSPRSDVLEDDGIIASEGETHEPAIQDPPEAAPSPTEMRTLEPSAPVVPPQPPTQNTTVASGRKVQEAAPLCGPRDGEAIRQSHSTSDDVTTIETEFEDCRSSVRIEGEIDFNADFTAIERLSSDGFLRLEVSRDDERRRMEVRPGPGGQPEFEWRVGPTDLPYDEAAAQWLEGALLHLFRSTSYKAEERAVWILAQDGVEGVLAEVEQMWSGHVQSRYLIVLLEEGDLSQPDIRRVFTAAREHVESDHALGNVLATAAERYSFDAETRSEFIEATRTLESDHQQAQALGAAIRRGDLSPENLRELLLSAREGLESDHQMAEILVDLAARYQLAPGIRGPFLDAASTLQSDHQKGRVYGVVLDQPGLDATEIAAVLDAAATMESDHQLAELLLQTADQDLADQALRDAFLKAARSIESDHNRAKVLDRALRISELGDEDLAEVLSSASTIESDHQLSQVLRLLAERRPDGIATRRSFLETAASIESDHNMTQTLSAFVALDLESAELTETLDLASREVDSDHQLAELLLEISQRYPIEGQVRDAFLRALDTIESKHQHGRVASAIVNN